MIVTKKLLSALNACTSGYRHALEQEVLGKSYVEVIDIMEKAGYIEDASWLANAIKSPVILSHIGNYTIMNTKYYVFNPLTGINEEFLNREEAIARNRALRDEYIKTNVDVMFNFINKEVEVQTETQEVLTVFEKEQILESI